MEDEEGGNDRSNDSSLRSEILNLHLKVQRLKKQAAAAAAAK